MEGEEREVDFHGYCPTCKHKDLDEVKDPCNECLGQPSNIDSKKPIYWEKKDGN